MTWVLLGFGLWCAALGWNAYRPRFAPPVLAVISFFAGWWWTEILPLRLLFQVGIASLLVLGGGLQAWPGWLGLALCAGAWAAAILSIWLATRTKDVLEDALEQGLGSDYRRRIASEHHALLADRPSAVEILVPFPLRPRDVEKITDIPFHEEDGTALTLDIYRSRSTEQVPACSEPRPVLLEVHGGGWVIGDKREQGLPLIYHLARRGWICVSANYRLSPQATFPDPLVDLKRAVAWIRTHGAEFNADPGFVVVVGQSAGAHLATLLALTPQDETLQPGFAEVDTALQGCVALYGIYDLVDEDRHWPHTGMQRLVERKLLKKSLATNRRDFEAASPLYRLTPEAPPFFVLHGTMDTMVPVAGARQFQQALSARSCAPVVFAELPWTQHAIDIFPSIRCMHVVHAITRFLFARYSEHRDATRTGPTPGAEPGPSTTAE